MTPREALGVPSPSYLQTPSGKVAYQVFGKSGPPLLCLHAVAHGGGDFEALGKRLAHEAQVIALDFPGHGHSPEDGLPPTADHYAQVSCEVAEALHLEHPILLGCSIGGAAAVLHAKRRPVRGIVLCNAGGLAPVGSFERAFIRAMVRFFRAGERGAGWFRHAYALYYRFVLPRAPERRRMIIDAGPSLAGVLAQAWQGFLHDDLRPAAKSLAVPTLAAWAAQDHIIPLERSQAALAQIEDVQILPFRGGHAAFLEDPELFAEALRTFIARCETRR